MPRRKELPFDPSMPTQGVPMVPLAADSEMQALMEAPPYIEPGWSKERLAEVREIVTWAVDSLLTQREQWVFNASVIERKPIRNIAAELSLSKSHVHRILNHCRAKLSYKLGDVPAIQEYLQR